MSKDSCPITVFTRSWDYYRALLNNKSALFHKTENPLVLRLDPPKDTCDFTTLENAFDLIQPANGGKFTYEFILKPDTSLINAATQGNGIASTLVATIRRVKAEAEGQLSLFN